MHPLHPPLCPNLTRWETHSRVMTAISESYLHIVEAPRHIHNDDAEKGDTGRQAQDLQQKRMNLNLYSCFIYGQCSLSNFTKFAMLFKYTDLIDHMYNPVQFTSAICFRHTRKF